MDANAIGFADVLPIFWRSRLRSGYSGRRLPPFADRSARLRAKGARLPAGAFVPCTRSSARSTLPPSEIANARKLGAQRLGLLRVLWERACLCR
jgi:hypothetical protein